MKSKVFSLRFFHLGSLIFAIALFFFGSIAKNVRAMPTTITDTTAITATNNGTVNVNEYIGFSTGINSGFGNVIGSNSQLHIDSDASGNLNLGLKAGAAVSGTDAMVVYLDMDGSASGFSTTNGFTDTADGCRRAISGYDGVNRATLNFPSGFTANYAICLDIGFAGLWQLTNGGSHTFITSLNRTNTGLDYEMNLTLANLGLSAGSSFQYVATYLNGLNAFRSDEFHGVSAYGGGNPGHTTVNLAGGDFNTFQTIDTTLVVDRTDDTNAAAAQVCNDALANDCSLRGAISKANADTTGSYTISFDASLNGTPITLSLSGTGEDANATGDLDITDELVINGSGARSTIVDANGIDRVFDIPSGGISVTLNDLTVQDGDAKDGDGGGIYNSGTLTLNRVTVSGSQVSYDNNNGGGGIFNLGTLTINQSLLENNQATDGSAGLDSGGGLFNTFTGVVNINNSTFSNNIANVFGGAIFHEGTAVIVRNSTLSGNTAFSGGGVFADSPIDVQNSIVTNSTGGDCDDNGGSGTITGSNNLIDDFGTTPCSTISIAGVSNLDITLKDNGGPTNTYALLAGSNALDIGTGSCPDHTSTPLTTDQRGVSRPQNATCDIGAFEYVTPVAPGTSGGNGPGGVGVTDGTSSLELWLNAGTGVTTAGSNVSAWADQSGNSANATQNNATFQPLYVTNVLNGQPVVRFDGVNDTLLGTNITATTFIAATSVGNGISEFAPLFVQNGADSQNVRVGGSCCGNKNSWLQFDANDFSFGGSIYVNSVLAQVHNFNAHITAHVKPTSTSPFTYRLSQNNLVFSNRYFLGDAAEIIVYNNVLPVTQRILVENYLSAKYNLSLSANNVYDGDTNGDFDLNVAGIGQLGGNQHTQAHSAGMIVVNNTFLNENGDWLLFGHKTTTNSNITTYLPTGSEWTNPNARHWARYWYMDVTDASNNNGTVNIIFDFSEAGMGSPSALPDLPVSNYRLLKRSTEVDPYTDITATSGATVVIVGDQVQFLGVDVSVLGSNFTLGTLDKIDSPTALTLQTFTARPAALPLAGLLALVGVALIGIVIRRRSK